jgi:hypothetical protein
MYIIIEKFQIFNQWKAFYLPTYSGKIIICPLLYPPYALLPFIYYPCWTDLPTYLPTYWVITARLPVLWMEFAKCRSFLLPEVSGQEFWWGWFGQPKICNRAGKWGHNGLYPHGSPSCPIYAKMDLQNGHVDFA